MVDILQPMTDFSYVIAEKKENYKESIIEKVGIKARFTLAEVDAHKAYLQKATQELSGQLELEKAKLENIGRNHPFVTEMKPEDLFTAALYNMSLVEVGKLEPKLKQIAEAMKEYDVEEALILDLLELPKVAV